MNNKTKGAIAGIAGIALLAGGTTFALWNDDASIAGGVITAGNLEVATVGTATWKDISADRTDPNHTIASLTAFKIIPGDTIEGTFGIDAALEGDNMVANLGLALDGLSPEGSLLADPSVVEISYSLVKADGTAVASATDIALGTPASVKFASADNSNNVATLPTLIDHLDGVADYKVVVNVHFLTATSDRERVQASADLQDLGVTLEQDRTAGIGGGF
ncbi:alternate-type signal peptide domain-containing protein [Paeniglutamicibacter sp. Y32M11]|uniref:alternate-type signal peptide domain-containing protein n=1 Tax=Paeniglutamicibacter sp. Y32M11 TaxID=2853258 RepID=UPI001C52C6A7|nr:alternate-type signal peptide domain-containing protein [Paeniglutamicibacter sp. Y32M11]QXQ10594.1 alternate-type signal peptide domain-containing protein [Paeniglutamicibacter sp. Y32M11]